MNSLLEVKFASTKKGKGVFAKKDIEKGMIIDIAYVVPIPNKDYKKRFEKIELELEREIEYLIKGALKIWAIRT